LLLLDPIDRVCIAADPGRRTLAFELGVDFEIN
jgi:hypothetical protein